VLAMTSSVAPVSVTLGTLLLLGAGMGLASGHAPAQSDAAVPLSLTVQSAADHASFATPAMFTAVETPADAEDDAEPNGEKGAVDLFKRSEAEQRIVTTLQGPLREPLDFVEQPLSDVAAILSETYDVPIQFDMRALNAAAASPDAQVSIQLSDVPLRSALRLMLGQTDQLTYIVRDDILMITTQEAADSWLETHIYDVGDAMSVFDTNVEELIKTIPETVSRDSWSVNGTGEGTIEPLGERHLAISQTQATHEEIARFLQQIASHAQRVATQSAVK
jgi:hypothetical protein